MSQLFHEAPRAQMHCRACDVRIPRILRTDRRFCTATCRKWWNRCPGRKRSQNLPGRRVRLGTGQPKTLAEARRAVTEARAQAKRLEKLAETQRQQTSKGAEQIRSLRNELQQAREATQVVQEAAQKRATTVEADRSGREALLAQVAALTQEKEALRNEAREALTEAHKRVVQTMELMKENAALRRLGGTRSLLPSNEVFKEAGELIRTLQHKLNKQHRKKDELAQALEMQNRAVATLNGQLGRERSERTQQQARQRDEVKTMQDSVERLRAEHATLGEALRQACSVEERAALQKQIAALREQVATRQPSDGEWTRERAELLRSRDEQRALAEAAQRQLQQRQQAQIEAVDRVLAEAKEGTRAVTESTARACQLERERREAAEATCDALRHELARMEQAQRGQGPGHESVWTVAERDHLLLRELASVRRHRDGMLTERQRLAERLLRLMAPGQYLAHATTAEYDPASDPLIDLKRREIRIEAELAQLQEQQHRHRRARRYDPNQTLDEQAYASALASRWRLIDRPHLRLPTLPTWRVIGHLLDADSERYLAMVGEKRIERMDATVRAGFGW